MSKQPPKIVVYKRSAFGALVKVASVNAYGYEAVISTAGCLRINEAYGNKRLVAAFAPGEWHVCKNFTVDWSNQQ